MNACPISVIGAVNLPMEIENAHCGFRSRGTIKDGDQQFGAWLRATMPNPFKKIVIRVPELDKEEGWDGFEMHEEKAKEGCSSKKDGRRGLEVSQVAVQSMEVISEKSDTVVD